MILLPRYKHLVQKPSCCGAACLQMILLRRGHWLEQEDLALSLGTKVKKNQAALFSKNLSISDENPGVDLHHFAEINESILKLYKLKATVLMISEIPDLGMMIRDNLTLDNDLIVNFCWLAYNPERNWGHFSLISSLENSKVELCDPSIDSKDYWRTPLKKLQEAMDKKWDGRERGIALISSLIEAQQSLISHRFSSDSPSA